MKRITQKGIAFAFACVPFFVSAAEQKGLVPCGNSGEPLCTFADFAVLGNRIVDFLLVTVLIPLATISIAIAGFRYILAFGNESTAKAVHERIKNTVIGIVIALAAYLIVKTVLSFFVTDEFNPFL